MRSNAEIAVSDRDHTLQVLRSIASLELAKGMIVLFAAVAALVLLKHEDAWDVADGLLRVFHISPDHHFAQVFLDWADTLTNAKIWAAGVAAFAYSGLRFAEAYGLWNARAWAEWIALISGSLYLPYEIYQLARRQSTLHIAIFLINLGIVLYMAYLLWSGKSLHTFPKEHSAG